MSRLLLTYTLARLGLLVAVVAVLVLLDVPVLVATLIGLVVAFGLSQVLFRGMRGRLEEELAASNARRRAERERLRGALRGNGNGEDGGTEPPGQASDGSAPHHS